MTELSRRQAAGQIAAVVAVFLAWSAAVHLTGVVDHVRAWRPAVGVLLQVSSTGVLLLALAALARWRAREPWSAIGLGRTRLGPTVGYGALAALGCYAAQVPVVMLYLAVTRADPAHTAAARQQWMAPFEHVPFALILPVAVTAGVCEEVLFRGLLLARFQALVRAWMPSHVAGAEPYRDGHLPAAAMGVHGMLRAVPVLGTAALFALGHVYQGGLGVLQTFVVGVILGVVALRRGNIWAGVVAHAGIDALSLVVLQLIAPAARHALQHAAR